MKSLFPDICSNALQTSKDFYVDLFEFKVLFDLGWYVQLCSPHDENLQIAFVDQQHESVPQGFRAKPEGVIVTLEVENADEVFQRAKKKGFNILREVCDEVWGQRHFFVVDPNNVLVDVFHLIEPDPGFLKQHGL